MCGRFFCDSRCSVGLSARCCFFPLIGQVCFRSLLLGFASRVHVRLLILVELRENRQPLLGGRFHERSRVRLLSCVVDRFHSCAKDLLVTWLICVTNHHRHERAGLCGFCAWRTRS